MKELQDRIQQLVKEELDRVNEKFPPFRSNHEAYAVLLEETEEAEHDFQMIQWNMNELWMKVKSDEVTPRVANDIKKYAINLAAEAIQIAAMAEKFLILIEEGKGERR